jgi:tetraacyldisaccharide 4'-kinase
VLVCADRFTAGQVAERRFGCSVHLLDDGFQHLRLARDVDLLVVAPGDCDERLLPSGRLREPVAAASAADALLVSGTANEAAALAARLGVATTFQVARRYEPVRLLDGAGAAVTAAAPRRVLAVAGIARPERFFEALRTEGWEVAGERAYRDHHWYSATDIGEIQRAARQAGADLIVTTEKDAVRLPQSSDARPAWAVLPLRAEIQPAPDFASWLLDRLAAARRLRGTDAA